MSGADLLEQAKVVALEASRRGAGGSRVGASRQRSVMLEWRDGRLDRVRDSTRLTVGAELFLDGRYSSSRTSDLRPEAIGRFLDDCAAMTRALAVDPHRVLPDRTRCDGQTGVDLGTSDPVEVTPAERERLARAIEAGARSVSGAERIVSVTAGVGDDRFEGALVLSNGAQGRRRTTIHWLGAQVSVRDEDHRKPSAYWGASVTRRSRLPDAAEIGREAARRALAQLGARPEKTGVYPCVVENRVVPRLLAGLLQPLAGGAVQQRASFLAGKIGETIGSSALDILDDPHLVEGEASRPYDGEGMATRRLPLFEAGVLRNYYLDTYYGGKLKLAPTTGSSTNRVLRPGKRSLDELTAAMGRGILVTEFIGGNSNPAAGDFSLGVRGFLVEGGKRTRPIVEMNLSGNHRTFWKQLVEAGNDPYPWSSERMPSLLLDGVQFSGV